jgi:ribosomal-protein-alanine N-acetyltransferase
VDLVLWPFDDAHAQSVLGWARTPEEAEQWASVPYLRLRPSLLRRWHSEPEVEPYMAVLEGEVCAYGKLLDDGEQGKAELGRVIVAPRHRGFGIGRRFVSLLVGASVARGFSTIWVRAVPGNAAATACYRAAGFERATPSQEDALNLDQDRRYVWMRYTADL